MIGVPVDELLSEEESRTPTAMDLSEGWTEDQDEDGIREVDVNTTEEI